MAKFRPRRRVYFVCLLICCLSCLYGEATFPSNTRFDPADRINSSINWFCRIPPVQTTEVQPDVATFCPQTQATLLSDVTIEEQDSVAQLYAPVLFFHPLEHFSLQNVDRTFSNPLDGRILYDGNRGPTGIVHSELNLTTLFATTRTYLLGLTKHQYYFEHDLTNHYVQGAGFDAQGRSNAPIYYNMFQHVNGSWIVNYFFYFSYHGASDIGIAMATTNDYKSFVTFNLRPFGEHEGDWESMSVMICPTMINASSQLSPLAVSYSQHSWRQITDCTTGDCVFYRDSWRPVGFVAKGTHALYPTSSARMVYKEFTFDFVSRVEGIVAFDGTNYLSANGTYRYFEPNSTNVLRLLSPSQIDPSTRNSSDYWMGFAGRWGGTGLFNLSGQPSGSLQSCNRFRLPTPICFDDNGTDVEECPFDNPMFNIVMQFLNIVDAPVDSWVSSATLLWRNVCSSFTGTGIGPLGPAARPEFTRWLPPINAPIRNALPWNTTSAAFCERLLQSRLFAPPPKVDQVNLQANVTGMVIFCVILIVGNVVVYTHPRFRGHSVMPLEFDKHCNLEPPSPQYFYYLIRPAIVYSVACTCTIVGFVLFFYGFNLMLRALEVTLRSDLGILPRVPYVMGVLVVLVDFAMILFIWQSTWEVWTRVKLAYYEIVGDKEQARKSLKWLLCLGKWAHAMFQICFGLLCGSLILAVLTVFIGALNAGIAYGASSLCNGLTGRVANVCIDLSFWGIVVECGQPFRTFCREWSGAWTIYTLWGALIVVVGQYYLIGSAGAASTRFRNTPLALQLLPTREEYFRRKVMVPSHSIQMTPSTSACNLVNVTEENEGSKVQVRLVVSGATGKDQDQSESESDRE